MSQVPPPAYLIVSLFQQPIAQWNRKNTQMGKDYFRPGIASVHSNVGFLGQSLIFTPVW